MLVLIVIPLFSRRVALIYVHDEFICCIFTVPLLCDPYSSSPVAVVIIGIARVVARGIAVLADIVFPVGTTKARK